MILFFVFFAVVLSFGLVVAFGAPYLPAKKRQVETAIDLLELKPGQTLYDLGCGDGKVLRICADRGIKAVGYELNPILYVVCKITCYRQRRLITVRYGNFWSADLSKADGVFVFLLDKFMPKLDKKLSAELKPGVKLASFTFKIPGKKMYKCKEAIFIYNY